MHQFFDFYLETKYTSLPNWQKLVLMLLNLSLADYETNQTDFKQDHEKKNSLLGMKIRQTIQPISCD